jgi:hypothetical protein
MCSIRASLVIGTSVMAFTWSSGAHAACPAVAGKWYVYSVGVESPAILTTPQTVVTGPTIGNVKNINVFKTAGSFNNRIGHAAGCLLTVSTGGSASASCNVYTTMSPTVVSSHTESATGNLAIDSSCNVSGSLTVKTIPFPLVLAGHINGNMGAGIARLAGQLHGFTIVRN